jgi:hypothetical protein
MNKRVKKVQKLKHGKYKITVFEEREIEPHGLGRRPTQ